MTLVPHRSTSVLASVLLGAALLVPLAGASAAATYTCDGRPATIVGTVHNDKINGTAGNDVIVGLGGNDVIHGRGGDDVICGFRDYVGAESNRDGRKDRLYGDDGNDRLIGTFEWYDTAFGGPGDDFYTRIPVTYENAPGPVAVDLATGTGSGWGNDTFGRVTIVDGTEFDDTLTGRDAEYEEECGCDFLYGHGGNDVIRGLNGNDKLYGGKGADRLEGGLGRDTMYPGRGADVVDGGSDQPVPDEVSYALDRRGVFVDLRTGTARGQGHDILTAIGEVVGSPLADVIHGDAGRNYLHGGTGDDVIRGHGGPDTLIGQAGNDRLYGNAGDDTAYGGPGTDRCRAEHVFSC